MNMKLLDLQTCKYLELETEWLHGGETIYITPTKTLSIKGRDDCVDYYYDDVIETIQHDVPTHTLKDGTVCYNIRDIQDSVQYKINGKLYDRGTLQEVTHKYPIQYSKKCHIKPHANPIINEIAEKVGAVVYGGRYVLLNKIPNDCDEVFVGDVIMSEEEQMAYSGCYIKWECFIADFDSFNDNIYYAAGRYNIASWAFYTDENIFEEYSKQLRNEPNKFDELYKLIYA